MIRRNTGWLNLQSQTLESILKFAQRIDISKAWDKSPPKETGGQSLRDSIADASHHVNLVLGLRCYLCSLESPRFCTRITMQRTTSETDIGRLSVRLHS